MPPKKVSKKTVSKSPSPKNSVDSAPVQRGFFKSLGDSIYSPEFYAEIPTRSLGKALLYLLGVTGLIALLYAVVFGGLFLLKVQPVVEEKIPEIQAIYPDELEVTLRDGQVYTNVNEPYFIEFPNFAESTDIPYEHLMVLDTKTPFSVQTFRDYRSVAWLTKDGLVVDTTNKTEIFPLNELRDGTLTKEIFDNGIQTIAAGLKQMAIPMGLMVAVAYWLFAWLFQLIFGLFLALLVWFVSALWRKEWTYGQSYKVGLHAMTLALFIQSGLIFLMLVWSRPVQFPFLFTLLCVLVVGFNLSQQPRGNSKGERV